MTEKQIMEYAIKGLRAEIEEKERQIAQGRRYQKGLDEYKGNLTEHELGLQIGNLKAEIEELGEKIFELRWQIDCEN